jgi:hypothetical protein
MRSEVWDATVTIAISPAFETARVSKGQESSLFTSRKT